MEGRWRGPGTGVEYGVEEEGRYFLQGIKARRTRLRLNCWHGVVETSAMINGFIVFFLLIL